MFALIRSRSGTSQPVTQIKAPPSHKIPIPEPPHVDLRNYGTVRTKLQNYRISLWSRYQRATTTSEKATIMNEAREAFVRSVHDEIFPYWYGTEWDFYGTTEIPGQGKIACGYFVSTVLRDLGMKVERSRLAQQTSENIILSLTTNDHTKRFRTVPINSLIDTIKNWGPGLYVVGLDIHVGFILNLAGDVYFIHSSYVDPYCVVKERAVESQILKASRYRVLGKFSEDDDLILKWLRGDQFMTRVA
jgi:hypothetical protein